MKRTTGRLRFFSEHKKWWLIGGVVTVALLLAGGVGWSFYAWQDYSRQYTAWHHDFKQEASKVFGLKTDTTEDKTAKLNALKNLQQTSGQGVAHCDAYGILHWQQFIGEVKTNLERCYSMANQAQDFTQQLELVVAHLEGEARIAKTFQELALPGELDETAWKGAADKWNVAGEALAKLSVVDSLKTTRKIAEDKAHKVHEAWVSLEAASSEKNRQKYETAVDQVGTAYSGLDQIGQESQKSFTPLVDKLINQYKRIFSVA